MIVMIGHTSDADAAKEKRRQLRAADAVVGYSKSTPFVCWGDSFRHIWFLFLFFSQREVGIGPIYLSNSVLTLILIVGGAGLTGLYN